MSMTELQELQKKWLEQNPLRKFRAEHNLSLNATASLLGLSTTALQKWESGAARPNEENLDKLFRLTGDRFIGTEWERWVEDAPKL